MKTTIGIFQGKQAENNIRVLTALYDNGPLTAWELTKIFREKNRMSLHAIFNKRLRILEKKGYVRRVGRKWVFQFKGIIATLIVQPQPKPFNKEWTDIINRYEKLLKEKSDPFSKLKLVTESNKEIFDVTRFVQRIPVVLDRFEDWVILANKLKELMEKGFINLDVIKNESLLLLIIGELSNSSLDTTLGA
jgi:hypothetical protein